MDVVFCIVMFFISAGALSLAVAGSVRSNALLGRAGLVERRKGSPIEEISDLLGRFAAERFPGLCGRLSSKRLVRRLAAAGIGESRAAGFSLARIVISLLLALAASLLSASHSAFAVVAAAAAGFFLTELWLRSRMRSRREAFERELPFALDMLTLCVEAGLDLGQAIARVAAKSRGVAACELRKVDAAIRVGVRRKDALCSMASSMDIPSVSAFAALLAQSERLGSGVAQLLRSTSERVRDERFARAEKRGAVAAQKLLLPLIVFIMPATLIVVFGPLFVRIATGGVEALF